MRGSAACAGLAVFLSNTRTAHAEDIAQGVTVGVEARLASVLWEDEFSGVIEGENRVARFHLDRSVRANAFGGAARVGWKAQTKQGIAFVLGGVFSLTGTPNVPVSYDTGLNEYEFSARGRWYSMLIYYEVQPWQVLALNAGLGYGGIFRWRKVGDAAGSDDVENSHVVAFGLRLRVPPGAPFAGYIGLGHEMLGFSPFKAFWESRWTIATHSYLAAGIEFDSLGLEAAR